MIKIGCRPTGLSLLLLLLSACSDGGSAQVNTVEARYTVIEPAVIAVGETSGESLGLELSEVQSLTVVPQ
ncbi:MAG: hypothetical protein ACSHXK_10720 [Oceanococcus sp.]